MGGSSDVEGTPSQGVVGLSKAAVRDYFAYRVVYPRQLPGIMRKHIYTGAMGNIYFTLIGGIFFVYYGTQVGMSHMQWSIMSGVSSLLLTSQLISALMTERMGRRKVLWFTAAIAGRLVRVSAIFASLVLWRAESPWALVVLIAGICLSNLLDAMASPPWLSWLADLIPAHEHGGFWGRRAAWVALSAVCVVLPAGILMDKVPDSAKVPVSVAIFVVAGIIGLADLLIHGTLPEPELPPVAPAPARARVTAPLRDKAFQPWLRFNFVWTFSMTLGGFMSTVFFFEQLHIARNFIGSTIVLTVFGLLAGVFTAPWSGRLVDRVGPRRVLGWGHFLWGCLPLFWIVATPSTALFWLGWSSIQGSVGSNAAVNAANKLITRLPAPQDRAMYAAVSSCLGNVASALGALSAGIFLKVLADWHTTVLGKTVIAFHLLFLISATLRLTTVKVFLPAVTDPFAAEAPAAAEAATETAG